MQLAPLVLTDSGRVGHLAAEIVANRVVARRGARLLLPTGRTPREMYAALRAHACSGTFDLSGAAVFQLDEYLGVGPADPRSCQARLRQELSGIALGTLGTLDGAAPNPTKECERQQRLLDSAPVDLAVLGLGRDAHVGFNEPGSNPGSGARVVALGPITRAGAADRFGGIDGVPHSAMTVGLRTLRAARELLVLVTGAPKAAALRAMLEGEVGPGAPASLLRDHPEITVLCDTEAAAELIPARGRDSDRAVIVLGHREPGISREHRISAESFARIHRAERVVRRTPPRLVVLTGYTSTGGRSEAEQMASQWAEREVPVLLEVAGRNTAENASRSLPLLRAMGDLRRVIVVSSAWHLRVPYMFAPYRKYGFDLSFVPAFGHGSWPRMLRTEFAQMRLARAQRRDAFAGARLPPARPTR